MTKTSRYFRLKNGTVLDLEKKLQWMCCSLGQVWDTQSCIDEAHSFTWYEIQNTIDEINKDIGYAGYHDWRLPSREELLTLVNLDFFDPVVDTDIFPATASDWYWSADIDATTEGTSWMVNFYDGSPASYSHVSPIKIRLVRSAELDALTEQISEDKEDKEIIENIDDFRQCMQNYLALLDFSQRMQVASIEPEDGVLTARIVGEFSAGKTRLIKELLGASIPAHFFPISSMDPQTHLLMEVSYAEKPALKLIKRAEDYDKAVVIKEYKKFPAKTDIENHDPCAYRLRMSVPEKRLILPMGDGFSEDTRPKRLFLIDTPGWNAATDDEKPLPALALGYYNLALIYVTRAMRLDSLQSSRHLYQILQNLVDADFLHTITLVFLLTECPESDAKRLKQHAHEIVLRLWQELGEQPADLNLHIMSVDFEVLDETEKDLFREKFWNILLDPIYANDVKKAFHPWLNALKEWPDEWDILPKIHECKRVLDNAANLLERTWQDEMFLNINHHRLLGLDSTEAKDKICEKWYAKLECNRKQLHAMLDYKNIELSESHPLYYWWEKIWLRQFEQAIQPTQYFFMRAENVLKKINTKDPNMQKKIHDKLIIFYQKAQQEINSSFVILVNHCATLETIPQPEKRLSTFLKLSIIQSFYEDQKNAVYKDRKLVILSLYGIISVLVLFLIWIIFF